MWSMSEIESRVKKIWSGQEFLKSSDDLDLCPRNFGQCTTFIQGEGQGEIIEGQNKNIIYRFALTLTFDHETWFKVSAQPFTWKHYAVEIRAGEKICFWQLMIISDKQTHGQTDRSATQWTSD